VPAGSLLTTRSRPAQEQRDRRLAAISASEYARERLEADPERWFKPYEKAADSGDWRAVADLKDRAYGRRTQSVTMSIACLTRARALLRAPRRRDPGRRACGCVEKLEIVLVGFSGGDVAVTLGV
jgi:hypothetical protein